MPPRRPTLVASPGTQEVIEALLKKHPGALVGEPEPAVLVPSGSLALDLALGGGYPKGRLCELYGPQGSGKTTITLAAIASFQRQGLTAGVVDMEHALDPPYMRACGVDVKALHIFQPDSAEAALDIVLGLCGALDLVVLDSIAALVPRAELEGEIGDSHVGLLARLLGQFTRKVGPVIGGHGTVLLMINQLRMKIGVMFGNPETTPGGMAVPYAASTRLEVRRDASLDVKVSVPGGAPRTEEVGARVNVRKLKTGMPFGVAYVPVRLGAGVNYPRELARLGKDLGVFDMKGNAVRFDGELLGLSGALVIERLRQDAPLAAAVDAAVRAAYAATPEERAPAPDEEDLERSTPA